MNKNMLKKDAGDQTLNLVNDKYKENKDKEKIYIINILNLYILICFKNHSWILFLYITNFN